jgi:hypothetical protein
VQLIKETTSSLWHREDDVLKQNPALIVIHRSCFLDPPAKLPPEFEDDIDGMMDNKFVAFLGFIATTNPQTKFLIYSRSVKEDPLTAMKWRDAAVNRFPALKGRMETLRVDPNRGTFRNPVLGKRLKDLAVSILGLQAGH